MVMEGVLLPDRSSTGLILLSFFAQICERLIVVYLDAGDDGHSKIVFRKKWFFGRFVLELAERCRYCPSINIDIGGKSFGDIEVFDFDGRTTLIQSNRDYILHLGDNNVCALRVNLGDETCQIYTRRGVLGGNLFKNEEEDFVTVIKASRKAGRSGKYGRVEYDVKRIDIEAFFFDKAGFMHKLMKYKMLGEEKVLLEQLIKESEEKGEI